MDRKLSQTPEIERLIRLSEASRSCLESEAAELRRRLDVPARLRDSLAGHPSAWMFGSLASGMFASLLFHRRPAKAKKRTGFSSTLIGLTLTAARPLAKVWLGDQLKQWASGSSARARPSESIGHSTNPANPAHVQSPGPGPR